MLQLYFIYTIIALTGAWNNRKVKERLYYNENGI